jgi:hypothetical protein
LPLCCAFACAPFLQDNTFLTLSASMLAYTAG